MRLFVPFIMLIMCTQVMADSRQVTAVVNAVLEGAKSRGADYLKIDSLFPSSLEAVDYEAITRQLMLDKLDLEDIGDKGVTYKWSAISHSLYKLAKIPNGAASIVHLWEDEQLHWDGSNSLELCDVAVRRGSEMLPLLEQVSRRKDAALRCMEHIRNGDKTAF